MADVGKESTFDLIQFGEFAIALFELHLVLLQLVGEAEFTEAKPVVEGIPRHNDDAGQDQEVEAVDDSGPVCNRAALCHGREEVKQCNAGGHDEGLDKRPVPDYTDGEQDEV